jgi:DUF4097 and DUF4098 domain-containing protein YvlB
MEMKTSVKIALLIVIVLTVVIVVLQSGLLYTPPALDQREERSVYTSNTNVVIDATIFRGNIEIQPTTNDQIEVIYTLKAPQGELSTITTQTNEAKEGDQTTIVTRAQDKVAYNNPNHTADLLIKLPASSQCNLTLISANGDITLPKLNVGKVSISTTNGNINIENDGNAESLEAVSMHGNVKISLAKNTLFYVAAMVVNGTINHSGITIDAEEQTATQLKGTTSAGEGTLSLALLASHGDITIKYH